MKQQLAAGFSRLFGASPARFFSAPGRTELGGNHTDHQGGCVAAASVSLRMGMALKPNGKNAIRLFSEGNGLSEAELNCLVPRDEEKGTTVSLIRGIAACFAEEGHDVPGFDAYVTSQVLPGSGLSSSAAFEVLLGTAVNALTGAGKTPVEISRIGQRAENEFFGKPCGLMDQVACCLGGAVGIDFADNRHPVVTPISHDFSGDGYDLCIVDCGADHASLTEEYASVPEEMFAVAHVLGKKKLRDVPEAEFYDSIAGLRRQCGDRAVQRAMHFFAENRRAQQMCSVLERDDFSAFLRLVRESGASSRQLLQNIIPTGYIAHQELSFALSYAEHILGGEGAARVHGGGFAGTIQCFVPKEKTQDFREKMERAIAPGCCMTLSISPTGACEME